MSPEGRASDSFEAAARRIEAELRGWFARFEADVLPALRQQGATAGKAGAEAGSRALRHAATALEKLAARLDASRRPDR
ncbi:MAG: hypothetical protein ACRD01_16030 [Terriglobales bacterium]